MGTNREIKSDGQINITSTQTNVSGDLDVTGSINNLTFPSGTGVNGQALVTNGSGTLSFGDVVGGGAGGINHITNTRATTDTTGYSTYADAAATTPADGTGGSPNITFTRNTTNPLRDGGDFKIAKDAANRQGQGVSNDFTIDIADKARKMIISFDYDASDSDYADGDIKIFIYDVTNTSLIRVNGEDLKGGKGKHYAQFQTASNSISYRLIFHISSTNAAAYDVFLDEISVGPQTISHGTIVTDWESYTPTFNGNTFDNINFQFRRVGDSIEVKGYAQNNGAPGSNNAAFSLPSGLVIDTAKVGASRKNVLGFGFRLDDSGGYSDPPGITAYYNSSSDSKLFIASGDQATAQMNQLGWDSILTGDNDAFAISAFVPIAGYSSNAKISEDFSGADVKANADLSSAVTISEVAGTQTDIVFNSEEIDSSASYNNSTGVFTVPESGRYLITAQIDTTAHNDWAEGDFLKIGVEKNASGRHYERIVEVQEAPHQTLILAPNLSVADDFVKGDALNVYIDAQYSGSGTLQASGGYFSITKLATAQTQLENETVACKAFVNADYTHSDANTNTIQYNATDFDTHAAFNTSNGVYTVPVSGYYIVSANVVLTSATGHFQIRIAQGGASRVYAFNEANDDNIAGLDLSDIDYYEKGEDIRIYLDSVGVTEDASYVISGNSSINNNSVNQVSIARLK